MPTPQAERRELRLSRRYPVACEKVWRAWTDPQALSAWFGPAGAHSVQAAELDVRVGGRYRIRFRTPDGEQHEVGGSYEEVQPQRKLVFSWAWHTTPERVSRVTVAMRPDGDGTVLELLHERFVDAEARTNHERGWTGAFANLDAWMASA
jgi:uncharacterized protein YndB with AHSA1/START domain